MTCKDGNEDKGWTTYFEEMKEKHMKLFQFTKLKKKKKKVMFDEWVLVDCHRVCPILDKCNSVLRGAEPSW